MIYLDNAATTPIDPIVLDAMMPYLTESYGNPSSLYGLGYEANQAVENARVQVAGFLNCNPENIVFTSGGSEANSLAILGARGAVMSNSRSKIIISKSEHESVYQSAIELARTDVYNLALFLADLLSNGEVDLDQLLPCIDDDVALVSVMHVNNEVGAYNNVRRIAQRCKEVGALFHTDCVQAAGLFPLDVDIIGCDTLSISGHKIGAPKGIGALYVRDLSNLRPIICGSSQQEHGLRGGTANVAGIVGLGMACQLRKQIQPGYAGVKTRKQFANLLSEYAITNHIQYTFNTYIGDVSKILSVQFPGVDAQTLVIALASKGVCASAGSACHSHSREASRTLRAMGLTDGQAFSTVRFSFDKSIPYKELEEAVKIIVEQVKLLQNIPNKKPLA